MNLIRFPSLLLATTALLAQGNRQALSAGGFELPKGPPLVDQPRFAIPGDRFEQPALPLTRTEPAAPALPAAARRLDAVLFDQDADGAILASSDAWKASFSPLGTTFVPFLGSQAPRNLPVTFRLRTVEVGGDPLALAGGQVTRNDAAIAIDHGTVREEYAASLAGIEQRFVLAQLPRRGAISVDVAVDSEFAVRPQGHGFVFEHEFGSFRYGAAVALDAAGERCELTTIWNGTGLALEVPAAFVAKARLPLTIDPLIGNVATVANSTYQLTHTDIAYDATLQQFVLCWERVYSQTDSDVYELRLDHAMVPIGGILTVDASGTSWSKPAIAALHIDHSALVVAECGSVSPIRWISARRTDLAAATLGAQFLVEQGAAAATAPDVGGDPSLNGPCYYTIVWERHASATDRDILFRQCDGSTMRGASYSVLDASLADEHSPKISKTDGSAPWTTQMWAIAYRRAVPNGGQTRMGFVSWNGVPRLFGQVYHTYVGQTAATGPGGIDVSSPSDENQGRICVVVDTWIDNATLHPVLHGTAVDLLGTVLTPSTRISDPSAADTDPMIDCDGARFAMTWRDASWDDPAYAVLDVVGASLLLRTKATVVTTATSESFPSITALHGANATTVAARQFGLAWAHTLPAGTAIEVQRLDAMAPGGFGTRGTGCGPLQWSVSGAGAIGEPLTMSLLNTQGLAGWAFGAMVDQALPFCPGCRQGTSADVALLGAQLSFTLPYAPGMVGLTVALQGFDFAAGTCLGSLALSNTADLTIR